mgnify:CR=1 FL=1
MGHPRFNIRLTIDTLPHANTILSNLSTKLATYTKFSTDTPFSISTEDDGSIAIYGDIRLTRRIDSDEIMGWVRSQLRDHPAVKTWILSARVTRHNCNHSDGQSMACDQNDFSVVWEKP